MHKLSKIVAALLVIVGAITIVAAFLENSNIDIFQLVLGCAMIVAAILIMRSSKREL